MSAATHRRLWLTTGWLTIAFVVLTFVGIIPQKAVTLGDKPASVKQALVTSSMSKAFAGYYVEFVAGLVFLAAMLLLARLLRGGGETTEWLGSCVSAAAIVYVAVSLATGGAAGAAAIYDGHHGASLATVTTVNDIRNIGYAISGGVAGLLVLAASGAGIATRLLPRWLCYAGFVVGVVLIAAVPAVKAGAPQTMLWFLWLVVIGVVCLRRARVAESQLGVSTSPLTA
ncbi:MAG TPA: hypothetical protein VFH54_11795 [Mycobacteriales bacterium]|nr:hypothetical protein [Mycobacteriales bacterium]